MLPFQFGAKCYASNVFEYIPCSKLQVSYCSSFQEYLFKKYVGFLCLKWASVLEGLLWWNFLWAPHCQAMLQKKSGTTESCILIVLDLLSACVTPAQSDLSFCMHYFSKLGPTIQRAGHSFKTVFLNLNKSVNSSSTLHVKSGCLLRLHDYQLCTTLPSKICTPPNRRLKRAAAQHHTKWTETLKTCR